ncbi:MAG: MlaD family protein [Solirubrobacteraceae bacterium]
MRTLPNLLRGLLLVGGAALLAFVLVLVLRGGSSYVIHAHFRDAGQLIKGDLVEVGGLKVGKIADLRLTHDGRADVVMKIDDGRFQPLHQGTVAGIGTVGLSGVTNRFVDLRPGADSAPRLSSGAVLDESQTRPIVDLDELLNSLTAPVRTNLQKVIKGGAQAFAGTPALAHRTLRYAAPALSRTAALASQVVLDRGAFRGLLVSAARVSRTLAARQGELTSGITSTATALRAVAGERTTLQDTLRRAPTVLGQADNTLRELRRTLVVLRPALRDARPAAAPLAGLLRQLVPTARDGVPVVGQVRATFPALTATLNGLVALSASALPALNATTSTLAAALPIFSGLRPYTPDVVQGLLHGLGASAASNFDANGHYTRVSPVTSADSIISTLLGPGIRAGSGYRTGLTARCPGGAVEPSRDGSNPYVPDPTLCNRSDGLP